MSEMSPNRKHRHVFAVVRLDDFQSDDAPLDERVYVKTVMLTEQAAQQAADRLNALNGDKGCRYVIHATHFDER